MVLCYEIDIRFIHDVVEHDLHSLDSTKLDIAACQFPIVHVHAGADAWTRLVDVEYAFQPANGALRDIYLLRDASHKLENNPVAARMALRQAVVTLKRHLAGEQLEPHDVVCPTFPDILTKHRQERVLDQAGVPSTQMAVSQVTT